MQNYIFTLLLMNFMVPNTEAASVAAAEAGVPVFLVMGWIGLEVKCCSGLLVCTAVPHLWISGKFL